MTFIERMKLYKLFVVLLWCVTLCVRVCHAGSKGIYCISNETGKECEASNVTATLDRLSALSGVNETDELSVYFTDGTHYLTENFNFIETIKSIIILGNDTVLVCLNNTGLYFNERRMIMISNITLEHCSRHYESGPGSKDPSALSLITVELFAFKSIIIRNSSGQGLHVWNCNEQVIQNCMFEGNMKGNIFIAFRRYRGPTRVSISLVNTVISSGFGGYNWDSGGMVIQVKTPRFHSTISIHNCSFTRNIGREGSHISIISLNNQHRNCSIFIRNCTFTEANGLPDFFTYGVFLRSDIINAMKVVIEETRFLNNIQGGLEIKNASNISINNCLISNNTGTGLFIERHTGSRIIKTIDITNTNFSGNSRALHLLLTIEERSHRQNTIIENCNFKEQVITRALGLQTTTSAVVLIEGKTECFYARDCHWNNSVKITNAKF